jgi:hypothetical protein
LGPDRLLVVGLTIVGPMRVDRTDDAAAAAGTKKVC